MAKRSLKQPTCSERDNAGCLSGFISIFGFHLGYCSQKLLMDRKRGGSRGLASGYSRKKLDFPSSFEIKLEDIDASLHKDSDEARAQRHNSGMVSVKALMEEEMLKTDDAKIPKNHLGQSQSTSELEIHLKERKKNKKKHNVVPDQHVNGFSVSSNLDFGQSKPTKPIDRSSLTYDLAEFMVQLNSCPPSESTVHRKKIHLDKTCSQFSKKYFTLQKALDEVAKVCLSQKLIGSKKLASNVEARSREFIDALEILNSNKELFVKLIEDPNLPILKHIQDIQDALVESKLLEEETSASNQPKDVRNELSQMQSHHKFLRKKEKSKGSDSSQDISKIVVLKPSSATIKNDSVTQTSRSSPLSYHSLKHQEEGEGTKSYFSLKGIKRRLTHVMGENRKERNPICMDGVLERIPDGVKDSDDTQRSAVLSNKTTCNSQQTSQPSTVSKRREKSRLKIDHTPCRESFFYEEAKKHLIEMVAAQDEKDSSPTVSKSLGRVISLSEVNLLPPRFNPGSDKELVLSPRKIILSPLQQFNRESPMDHLSPLRHSLDQDVETQVTESNQECTAKDMKTKGNMEIKEALDFKPLGEHVDLIVLPESVGNEPGVIGKEREGEGSSALLELEMPDGRPQLVMSPLSSSQSFLHREKLENPEGPSPVSVLEPFFLEDSISPGSTTSDHDDLHLQPQKTGLQEYDGSTLEGKPVACFNERDVLYGFVSTILKASGMRCYGILERWNSSDQLLDPSLLEEVGNLHSLLPDDPKLLFDYINEVLVVRLFECTPWVSLINPSSQVTPRRLNLIEEDCKGIDKQLQLSQFMLDHNDQGRSWMDFQIEIDAIVIEMADDIFDEIIDETISR